MPRKYLCYVYRAEVETAIYELHRQRICFMRPTKTVITINPVSILYKAIAGRYRPVRVADGPITARYRFIKNASSEIPLQMNIFMAKI